MRCFYKNRINLVNSSDLALSDINGHTRYDRLLNRKKPCLNKKL